MKALTLAMTNGRLKRSLDQFIKKIARKDGLGNESLCVNCVSECVCALHTNEGGDLGVDDAAGEEVKVVFHRVDHHRVSCVVAALQRRDKDR